ncbi:MAG: excinuclease ABC subunit UvrB, partial [Vulcanimicrobiota bacterium]
DGAEVEREFVLERLINMQYSRTTITPARGQFRIRGEILEICPAHEDQIIRVEFFGDEIDTVRVLDHLTGEVLDKSGEITIFPAKHFITTLPNFDRALTAIEDELRGQIKYFKEKDMYLEAQRIEMRTRNDLELLKEIGYCNGVENYSRHLTGRKSGEPPFTLIDYFPGDFVTFIDESHVTIPQLRGMQHGDRSRKKNLIEYGFRLPSAFDNRPLSFEEFLTKVNQVVYVSATPGPFELENSARIVEQVIRPTGLVDPEIIIRPVAHQVDDLIGEIRKRTKKKERVLVTTLTKKMSEDLTDYLNSMNIRVRYLHSEIDSLERIEILRDLRLGRFDVLVGINLLREGLDLPEVSLVAILDADKEGFLRSETSLIQTIGRAARNVSGTVILYADEITKSIRRAVDETQRRRHIQLEYNREHNIEPQTIRKAVKDILGKLRISETSEVLMTENKEKLSIEGLEKLIREIEEAMRDAAKNMEFETAAALRDEMFELKKELKARVEQTPVALLADREARAGGLG